MNGRLKSSLLWTANLLYDLFCAAVNVSDVASDIVICVQFYLQDQLVFFWLCIAIFAIAQICYSVLFTALYGTKYRDTHAKKVRAACLCFLCILPFGQVVPLIVWIGAFKFKWFDKICECLGLEVRDDVKNEAAHSEDPLKNYIMMKVVTHGGFMIESIVESVPQSILQMVAIVIYKQTNIINVVSLAISIISVSSRGLMLSYSIHRPTFVFNFTCFIADVFRVFCVVSWLFFTPPSFSPISSNSYHIFFLAEQPIDDVFTYIWWWKECVIVCMAFFGGILLFFSTLEAFWRDNAVERSRGLWKSTFSDIGLTCLLAIFGLVIFVPFLIVLEAMILSAFPVLVFRSLSSEYANYARLYQELFAWMLGKEEGGKNRVSVGKSVGGVAKSTKDFRGKVRAVNRFYAKRYLEETGHKEETGWKHPKANIQDTPDYILAVKIMGMSDEMFSISEARKKKGFVLVRMLRAFARAVWKEARKKWQDKSGFVCVGILYMSWLCLPMMILSACFSLLYPLFSFFSVPWEEQGLLQQLFSLITFILFGVLLLLSFSVYRFYKCSSSIEMFYHYPSAIDVSAIKLAYAQRFAQRAKENTGRMGVLIANAHANRDSELVNHVVAVLPEITKFAGFSDAFAIDIDKFLASKTFGKLAKEKNLCPLPSLSSVIPYSPSSYIASSSSSVSPQHEKKEVIEDFETKRVSYDERPNFEDLLLRYVPTSNQPSNIEASSSSSDIFSDIFSGSANNTNNGSSSSSSSSNDNSEETVLPVDDTSLIRTASEQNRAAELLSGAIRSVGIDPQKIIDGLHVPSTFLHKVNSQYHAEIESSLLREAEEAEAEAEIPSLEIIRPDKRDAEGHVPAAIFRQNAWQKSVQQTQHRTMSLSPSGRAGDLPPASKLEGRTLSSQVVEMSLPSTNPNFARSHTT